MYAVPTHIQTGVGNNYSLWKQRKIGTIPERYFGAQNQVLTCYELRFVAQRCAKPTQFRTRSTTDCAWPRWDF